MKLQTSILVGGGSPGTFTKAKSFGSENISRNFKSPRTFEEFRLELRHFTKKIVIIISMADNKLKKKFRKRLDFTLN